MENQTPIPPRRKFKINGYFITSFIFLIIAVYFVTFYIGLSGPYDIGFAGIARGYGIISGIIFSIISLLISRILFVIGSKKNAKEESTIHTSSDDIRFRIILALIIAFILFYLYAFSQGFFI